MTNSLDDYVVAYEGDNIYDFDNEILLTWYPQRILHHAGEAKSLLELGLGHGYTAEKFSASFERHVILEGSSAVIKNFKNQNPDCAAEIIETWFEEFATEERFDLIVMGFILEHVEDPGLVLELFKKFLAPGGRIFVSVPNAEVMNRRLGCLAGMLDDVTQLSDNDLMLGHHRFYTNASFREEIANAGFEVERMEGVYLKPFTSSQMQSLRLDSAVITALCELGIAYPELSCGLLAEITVR